MKIRTLTITLLLCITLVQAVFASTITRQEARIIAQNFFLERIMNNQTDWKAEDLNLQDAVTLMADATNPAIYVFTNNGNGFILISAEQALSPVLGYSFNSSFPQRGENENYDRFINEYIAQVNYVRQNNMQPTDDILTKWNNYSIGNISKSTRATTDVTPLITSLWNQDSPYNDFCPSDPDGPGGHVYAGCVATAMSMIMHYYRYPLTGSGSKSYFASGYGTQSVNYGATTYQWDAMQGSLSTGSGQGIPANAELQYHAGVSVNMQYGAGSSGAYSTDVPNAMKTYFKYSPTIQYVSRSGYNQTNWENLLVEQLDARKPLYYSGYDPTPTTGGGHAFLCDGYQVVGTSKEFHFNFGWSGSGNGYYTINNPNGFTQQHAVVRNFIPNPSAYPYGCSAKTIEIAKGSFEDGSGPLADYGNNLACTWLLAPTDSATGVSVSFIQFDVADTDSLYFYNGSDENAPRLGAFSGNTLPPTVTSTVNKMFIKFVTDGANTSKGWLADFNAVMPALCSGTKTMTDANGSFSDGSADHDYQNNAMCKYKIQPTNGTDITLTFSEFDLVEGDKLIVYKIGSSTALAELTGNQLPQPLTVASGGFYIVFQTDKYYTAGGFTASYSIGNVSAGELKSLSSLNISPNPASDFIMVRAISKRTQTMELAISDMTGKVLYNESFVATAGSLEKSVSVESLKKGLYMLTLQSEEGKITEKLIIK